MSRSHVPERGRKALPLATGLLDYFPDALLAVADLSRAGATQHKTMRPDGTPSWDRTKSTDHPDALMRHMLDRGRVDVDGIRHTVKVAWRALAMLQTELEAEAAVEEMELADKLASDHRETLPFPAEAVIADTDAADELRKIAEKAAPARKRA